MPRRLLKRLVNRLESAHTAMVAELDAAIKYERQNRLERRKKVAKDGLRSKGSGTSPVSRNNGLHLVVK